MRNAEADRENAALPVHPLVQPVGEAVLRNEAAMSGNTSLSGPQPVLSRLEIAAPRAGAVNSKSSWLGMGVRVMVVLAVAVGLYYVVQSLNRPADTGSGNPLTYTVSNRTLFDTVIERGTLESQKTVNGKCELPGWQNKIIFIMREGARVKKDEVVVRFDSAEFDKQIKVQEAAVNDAAGKVEQAREDIKVQSNTNDSAISAAELANELAKLDLEKYVNSEYPAEHKELNRSIAEDEAALEKVEDELSNLKALVRKGFRAAESLREVEHRRSSAEFALQRDKSKLTGLENYAKPRRMKELNFNSAEAERKLERAKKTAEAETRKKKSVLDRAEAGLTMAKSNLENFEKQRDKCEIKAPIDGTLSYANSQYFDPDNRIKEGASVRREQIVFKLPDMRKMQVQIQVHESMVNKVEVGQKVAIRVDSYPDKKFSGVVKRVSELASSTYGMVANNYKAVVTMDEFPEDIKLKPGMTAEAEIKVGTYKDVVAVPISGATEHFQQSYVYVKNGTTFERRKVVLGRATNSFVEVVEGLEAGAEVALDAYQRGMEEFGDREKDVEKQNETTPAAAPTNSAVPAR